MTDEEAWVRFACAHISSRDWSWIGYPRSEENDAKERAAKAESISQVADAMLAAYKRRFDTGTPYRD